MSQMISIIMPVFKTEKFVARALSSIKTHNTSVQVLIVNDGGPSDITGLIKPYYSKFDDIQIINHEQNYGALKARLTGSEKAVGDYIHFFDPDDCISPYGYDAWIDLASATSADIVQFPSRKIDANGFIGEWEFANGWPKELQGEEILSCFLKKMNNWTLWNKLFSRRTIHQSLEIFNKIEIFNILSGNDIPLLFTLLLCAKSYIRSEYFGYYYLPNRAAWTQEEFLKNYARVAEASNLVPQMIRKICDITNMDASIKKSVEQWLAIVTGIYIQGIRWFIKDSPENAFNEITRSSRMEYIINNNIFNDVEFFRLLCRGIANELSPQ